MADNVNIKINIDASNASKSVGDLAKGIDNVTSNVDDSLKSLLDFRKEMKEIAVAMQAAGQAGDKAAFDKLKAKFTEVKDAAKGFREETIPIHDQMALVARGVGSLVQAGTNLAVVFGADSKSAEELFKTFAKAQAITNVIGSFGDILDYSSKLPVAIKAVATSIRGMSLATVGQTIATNAATVSQWALNAAMMANPIGLVVIALTALAAAIYVVVSADDAATTSSKARAQAMIETIDLLAEQSRFETDLAIAQGKSLKSIQQRTIATAYYAKEQARLNLILDDSEENTKKYSDALITLQKAVTDLDKTQSDWKATLENINVELTKGRIDNIDLLEKREKEKAIAEISDAKLLGDVLSAISKKYDQERTTIRSEEYKKQQEINKKVLEGAKSANSELEKEYESLRTKIQEHYRKLSEVRITQLKLEEDEEDNSLATKRENADIEYEIESDKLKSLDRLYRLGVIGTKEYEAEKTRITVEETEKRAQMVTDLTLQGLDIISSNIKRRGEDDLTTIATRYDKEERLLNDKLNQGLISQQQYDAAVSLAQAKKADEERKIKEKIWKADHIAAIAQSTTSTILAVMKGYEQTGFLGGTALAVIMGALGTAQTALIASQKMPEFAEGGYVQGTGDRDNVHALLTPGEFVIKKDIVEQINSGNMFDYNKMAAMLSSQRVVVVESDITKTQNNIRRVETKSSF